MYFCSLEGDRRKREVEGVGEPLYPDSPGKRLMESVGVPLYPDSPETKDVQKKEHFGTGGNI